MVLLHVIIVVLVTLVIAGVIVKLVSDWVFSVCKVLEIASCRLAASAATG